MEKGYRIKTVVDYAIDGDDDISIILRHDVDYRKRHALNMARILHEFGIKGTFYFRIVPNIFDKWMIREIHDMDHEIGYHYEDLYLAKGKYSKAIDLFSRHLNELRDLVPIRTICMHGSPLSKYDNRDLWRHYNYREFDIVAEPYFDFDFMNMLYVTDTGGRWDGNSVSIRDKVKSGSTLSFHSTFDIMGYIQRGGLEHSMMLNFHPHRWTDNLWIWSYEQFSQKLKNPVKFLLNVIRRTVKLA